MPVIEQQLIHRLRSGSNTVYGVVLNDQTSLDALSGQLDQAPYKQPPQAPVMYIKPRNTIVASGATVELPTGEEQVEIGATLGLVAAKTMTRVTVDSALSHLAGALLVADLSLPHDSYYRPAVREQCFDGALPVAGYLIPLAELDDSKNVSIAISVNDQAIAPKSFDQQLRSLAQLLADVTEFMTLRPGNVLLVGVSYQAPRAKVGDRVNLRLSNGSSAVSFTLSQSGGES